MAFWCADWDAGNRLGQMLDNTDHDGTWWFSADSAKKVEEYVNGCGVRCVRVYPMRGDDPMIAFDNGRHIKELS